MIRSTRLSHSELTHACQVGVARHLESVQNNRENRAKKGPLEFSEDIIGAIGEMAFAKMTGRYWDFSVNTFTNFPDVGEVEVRTRSRHDWDHLIRPWDKDDRFYVCVTLEHPFGEIRYWGGMYGSQGKEYPPEDKGNYGAPAHFIPKDLLMTGKQAKNG